MISYKEGYAVFRPINLFHFDSQLGGLQPEKKPKKTSPKFEICGSVRFFSVFFGFFGFLWYFFGFFRSEVRQEIPAIQKSCQQ